MCTMHNTYVNNDVFHINRTSKANISILQANLDKQRNYFFTYN